MKHIFQTNRLICFLLITAIILTGASCNRPGSYTPENSLATEPQNTFKITEVKSSNLMEEITVLNVTDKPADEQFIENTMNYSIELFKKVAPKDESSLVSPLSTMLALSMTANGADNATRTEMEKLLGGEIPLDTLNEYLCTYSNSLPPSENSKLHIANSIWFRDAENRLKVQPSFLQKNADYYNATAYKAPFNDATIKDINAWVSDKTDGMIDEIIDTISDNNLMYLINAIVFDAKWETKYNSNDISDETFNSIDGNGQTVKMMFSKESRYIKYGNGTGFIKDYANKDYSFVALLPDRDVNINDYIASFTGKGFADAVNNASYDSVKVFLPKFSYSYSISLNDSLKALGIPTAFDPGNADFSKMATSSGGNIYIGNVLHKTFISVDESGTKAAAVTKVGAKATGMQLDYYTVKLDRPFVYAIIDNATGLPIFLGTVMSI